MSPLRFANCLMAGVLAMAAGCSSMNLATVPFIGEPGGKPQSPGSVVAIWSDSMRHEPGQPAQRGFAGQLMFYGKDQDKPVKVEGSLQVYAFDEEGRDPVNVKPDRKYVFTEEQLAGRFAQGKLGPCYTVWIPWDSTGGPQKEVSLIARFVDKEGRVVVSEQSKHVLFGPPQVETAANRQGKRTFDGNPHGGAGVQQAAFQDPGQADATGYAQRASFDDGGAPVGQTQTLTIALPSYASKRWATSTAPERFTRQFEAIQNSQQGEPEESSIPQAPRAVAPRANSDELLRDAQAARPFSAPGFPTRSELPASGNRTTAWMPGPPSVRFPHDRSQAPGGQVVPPGYDRAASPLRPGESPYHPAFGSTPVPAVGLPSRSALAP